MLFGYADEAETESILHKVLLNEEVAAITTPYFKFYELEALAKLGRFDVVMDTLKSYWGGLSLIHILPSVWRRPSST